MKLFKKIQYIALYVLSLVIIGATSLISADLGFSGFKSGRFYFDTLLSYAAILCVVVATLLKINEEFKTKNEEYLEKEQKIKDFASKSYVPSIFYNYCSHANQKRKRAQYVYNLKQKLYQLEKTATDEDITVWIRGSKEDKERDEVRRKAKPRRRRQAHRERRIVAGLVLLIMASHVADRVKRSEYPQSGCHAGKHHPRRIHIERQVDAFYYLKDLEAYLRAGKHSRYHRIDDHDLGNRGCYGDGFSHIPVNMLTEHVNEPGCDQGYQHRI
jgi:hypothetical protein